MLTAGKLDAAGAKHLAEQSRDAYSAVGQATKEQLAEVEAWLAALR